MPIDLRADAYPSLMEAIGLAIVRCDGMERSIPRVFRAALNVSIEFQVSVFEATRGLEVHLRLADAAVLEGAPEFYARWQEVASIVRSCAGRRGKVAHSGMSIYGGGLIVEVDEDGAPTGIARVAGPPIASLRKETKMGAENISEQEIRELANRALLAEQELHRLSDDIRVRSSQSYNSGGSPVC